MRAVRRALGTGTVTVLAGVAVSTGVRVTASTVRELRRAGARAGWEALPLDTVIACGAAVVLAGAAAWLGLGALVTLVDVATGVGHTVASRMTPALVRRTIAVACGAALGGSSGLLAHATDAGAPAGPARAGWHPASATGVLTGLPLPDRPLGTAATTTTAASRMRLHVVRRGDSLWSVTARALPPGASAAAVAPGWRRLYAVNRDRVGEDPDLLLPGTVLRLPRAWPTGGHLHPHHREDPS